MKSQNTMSLDPATVAIRLGMCATAIAGTAGVVASAQAAVVNVNTTIAVPNSFDGIYLNFLTGASSTGPINGWDFNPYSSTTGLSFFWNTNAAGTAASTDGAYLDLAASSVISSDSFYSNATGSVRTTAFRTTGTHTLGFRFFNESTNSLNYGYLTMDTTGSTGFPATIKGWSYEDSGAAITVGGSVTAVPEPSTALMLSLGALALGATNLRNIRRQRRKLTA